MPSQEEVEVNAGMRVFKLHAGISRQILSFLPTNIAY